MCVHKNDDGSCRKYIAAGKWWFCIGEKCPDYAMSNADQFRNMTDEGLAAYIAANNTKTICDIVCGDTCKAKMRPGISPQAACREVVARLLTSPAKQEEAAAGEWAEAVERMGEK